MTGDRLVGDAEATPAEAQRGAGRQGASASVTGPPRRPTMADVGRLAGVSASTVSFVLNDTPGQVISEATRKRVLDAVEVLGYRRNYLARSLRTRKTATVGFVTDEIAIEPFAGATILGANEVAWEQGSLLVVVNTTRDARVQRDVVEELLDRHVDSVILAYMGTRRVTVPDRLIGRVPTLLLNGFVTGDTVPCVLPDEVAGGAAATQMLLDAGHTRITFLAGAFAAWATKARLRGFRSALTAAGLDPHDQQVLEGNYRSDSGYELTRELLRSGPAPTAIMCGNDRMALGVLFALSEAGLKVPDDVSVVGYDDQEHLAAHLHPALSTVRLPYYQMGRWAAERLLQDDLSAIPPRTLLAGPAVPRESVGIPRSGAR